MSVRKIAEAGSLRLLLRGMLVWIITALALLLMLSFILARVGTGSEILGYLSSGISFFAALAAGIACGGGKTGNGLLQGMFMALVLILTLLTVGFLASQRQLDPSGVLSVVSFTAAGVLLGNLMSGGKKSARRKRAKNRFRVGRKG